MRNIIEKMVEERMNFIASHRERFIEAWVAETGLHPSDCVMMQQETNEGLRIWFERKPDDLPKIDEGG